MHAAAHAGSPARPGPLCPRAKQTKTPPICASGSMRHAAGLSAASRPCSSISSSGVSGQASTGTYFRNWLEPTAHADGGGGFTGPVRYALWLGGDRVAVSGWDDRLVNAGGYLEQRSTPAGVTLVDTADWTTRRIDEGASDIKLADGALLAYGSTWDGSVWSGIGLRVLLEGRRAPVRAFRRRADLHRQGGGGYAYPQLENSCRGWVIDLRSGKILRELDFNPDFEVSSSCDWPSLLDG
jgi:hypothetical protein